MGAAPSDRSHERAADDGRGSYLPPPLGLASVPGDEPRAAASADPLLVVRAVIRIQRLWRSRQARKHAFGFSLSTCISTLAHDIGAASHRAVVSAQGSALGLLLSKADGTLQETYVSTLRPSLVPCPATPTPIRYTVNMLGDRAWDSAHASLVGTLGEVLSEKFVVEREVALGTTDEAHERRRATYNTSETAWREADWRTRARMLLMRARAALLYAYNPYDQTIYVKLGSWDCVLMLLLLLLPHAWVRNTLYSAVLLCLTLPWSDISAGQYMQVRSQPMRARYSEFVATLLSRSPGLSYLSVRVHRSNSLCHRSPRTRTRTRARTHAWAVHLTLQGLPILHRYAPRPFGDDPLVALYNTLHAVQVLPR